jgi:hypothetical protein
MAIDSFVFHRAQAKVCMSPVPVTITGVVKPKLHQTAVNTCRCGNPARQGTGNTAAPTLASSKNQIALEAKNVVILRRYELWVRESALRHEQPKTKEAGTQTPRILEFKDVGVSVKPFSPRIMARQKLAIRIGNYVLKKMFMARSKDSSPNSSFKLYVQKLLDFKDVVDKPCIPEKFLILNQEAILEPKPDPTVFAKEEEDFELMDLEALGSLISHEPGKLHWTSSGAGEEKIVGQELSSRLTSSEFVARCQESSGAQKRAYSLSSASPQGQMGKELLEFMGTSWDTDPAYLEQVPEIDLDLFWSGSSKNEPKEKI